MGSQTEAFNGFAQTGASGPKGKGFFGWGTTEQLFDDPVPSLQVKLGIGPRVEPSQEEQPMAQPLLNQKQA